MRQALRQNPARSQSAVARSIPAPVGGWNTEDAQAAMPKTDAVILDNWIPRGGLIEMRAGHVDHVSGTASPVETLIVYGGTSSGDTIFACAGANIYNVTTAGALPATSYGSAQSARWNWVNFSNDAGRFVLMANGLNTPMKYDGATFSTSAVTGTSGAITLVDEDLKFVMAHKARIHYAEKARLRVWFLAVNAIAGASSLLDLGPFFSKGGTFAGIGTWTLDSGMGPDDYAVYVTTEGQVAVYQGTDPSSATDWALVGVYDIPKPIGDRCLIKNGGDLLILTEAGIVSMATITLKDEERQKVSPSRKITTALADSAKSYSANDGWQMQFYPGRGRLLIINVPTTENAAAVQYVRNMEAGGWCRFTGINAICWAYANGALYFGGAAGVYQADKGSTDNSEPIVPDVLPAFQDFGNRTVLKDFTMVRALLRAPSVVRPALEVVTDYDKATLPTAVQTVVAPGDISADDGTVVRDDWTGAAGIGYVGAPRMRFSLTGEDNVDQVAVTSDLTEILLVGPGGTDNILTRPNLPLEVTVQCIGWDVMFKVGGQL